MKVVNTFVNLTDEDKLRLYHEILKRIKPRQQEEMNESLERNIRKTKQG